MSNLSRREFLKNSVTVATAIGLGSTLNAKTTTKLSKNDTSDEMKVMILGSGSPNYNPNRASAGVLIQKSDTDILVDMGSGVRANLYKAGINDRKIDVFMFTHHHMDHDADFDAIVTRTIVGQDPIKIYGTVGTEKFVENYLDFYKEDLDYRLGKNGRNLNERKKDIFVKDLKSGDTFNIEDIKVSSLHVPHSIETLAYRFDYKKQSIVITGDLTYTDKLAPFAKDADCMIIDSGGMIMKKGTELKRKGKGSKNSKPAHLNLNESSLIAGNANVKNLVYTHFLPGTIDEDASLKVIRKNYKGKVTFSKDLMQIECIE